MIVDGLLSLGGLIIGVAGMWLWSRSSTAVLRSRLEASERGQESAEGAAVAMRDEVARQRVREAELVEQAKANVEKLAWVDRAQAEMEKAFGSLAGKALRDNTAQVMAAAKDSVVKPLEASLTKLDEQVRELESRRAGAYGEMLTQLQEVQRANTDLTRSTTTLSEALRSSSTRGKWGELQLRRVVELAGLTRHVDFVEQAQVAGERPDMVVRLPNGGSLPVDAKAPMTAYLDSLSLPPGEGQRVKLEDHAAALRSRIRELGGKQYWKQLEPAPEFVVLFVPIEACLSAAFEVKPDLLEFAIEQKVLVCSPVTLLALLKAVAFGFQQQAFAENVKEIEQQNRELYVRLGPWLEHVKEMGVRLDGTVKAYNAGVGSLEARVLPIAEKLRELGVGSEEMPAPKAVDQSVRQPK